MEGSGLHVVAMDLEEQETDGTTQQIIPFVLERELITRARDGGSPSAAGELLDGYHALIENVAGRYARIFRVDLDDLVQEASCGFLEALHSPDFTPQENVPFWAFARFNVRNKIRAVCASQRYATSVKTNADQLVQKWSQTTARLSSRLGRPPTEREVMEASGMTANELQRIRKAQQALHALGMYGETPEGEAFSVQLPDVHAPAPDQQVSDDDEMTTRTHLLTRLIRENLTNAEQRVILRDMGIDTRPMGIYLEPQTVCMVRRMALQKLRELIPLDDEQLLPSSEELKTALATGKILRIKRHFAAKVWKCAVDAQRRNKKSESLSSVARELRLPSLKGNHTHPDRERRKNEYLDEIVADIDRRLQGNRHVIRRRWQRIVEKRLGICGQGRVHSQRQIATEEEQRLDAIQTMESKAVRALYRVLSQTIQLSAYQQARLLLAQKIYQEMWEQAQSGIKPDALHAKHDVLSRYFIEDLDDLSVSSGSGLVCKRIIERIECLMDSDADAFPPIESEIIRQRFCIGRPKGAPEPLHSIAPRFSLKTQQVADIAKKIPRRILSQLEREKERADIVGMMQTGQITQEAWLAMNQADRARVHVGGRGLNALASLFGISGNPISQRKAFLLLSEQLFASRHPRMDVELEEIRVQETMEKELGSDPRKWRPAILSVIPDVHAWMALTNQERQQLKICGKGLVALARIFGIFSGNPTTNKSIFLRLGEAVYQPVTDPTSSTHPAESRST